MRPQSIHKTHSSQQLGEIIRFLTLMLAAGLLASCGSASTGIPIPSRPALPSELWYMAQDEPPTYFPKEVPANYPTTHRDGMWVITGDAIDTRYFIPNRGVDTKKLVAEALAAVTPERRQRLESDRMVDRFEDFIPDLATGLLQELPPMHRSGF